MAEIAVKMATAAGQQLVGELVGRVSLLMGVRGEVQYIIDELEIMRGFLKEAEARQAGNEDARAWVKQVRRLAYDIEDCLDDFSLHLHRGAHPNPLARLVHSLGSLTARRRIATQIQNIKLRVEEASSRRMRYGIIANDASRAEDRADADVRKYDPRLSALFVEDSQLVGIDGPRQEIVGLLLDETKRRLGLITVVGEGGLGKTTIVKKAYNDPRVTGGHFKCRVWITISQTYNVDWILRDIIKQVTPTVNPSSMQRVQLIEELSGHLEHTRYMIVFDDVWKVDAWKSLEMALPKNHVGSRIILTTRNKELAESACATPSIHGHIYNHNKLSPGESTELFLRRVFKDPEQKVCPGYLEDLSRAILEKCDGLPLAIISIAGVLASKPNKSREEWENMKSQLASELEHNPNLEGMNQILMLSYNDLPYHVRHCFLYLSKFPEDYVIGRKHIQRLWIAEGFVSGRHDMTAEEAAESYFNELANRFMILPLAFNTKGKVKSFRVHDIILELISSKSREESFLSLVIGNKDVLITSDVIRRLSIHGTNELVGKNLSTSNVRSLTVHNGALPTLISPLFGMLRVMDLQGCDGLENKHLKIVAKLLHLKYLSLRYSRSVDELPGCMKRLRKLETLDIKYTNISELPEGIIQLQQLRFLRGGVRMKIPRGIGRLSALQVLTCIDAKWSGKQAMKELHKLIQLQKLVVDELSEELMEDFCDSLAAMRGSLISLRVAGVFIPGGGWGRLDGLNSLSEPPRLLESLHLRGVLKQLPTWVISLGNLAKLSLTDSYLEEEAIQSLGSLPNLIRLELKSQAVEGGRLCFGAQGFPRLKELILSRLPPSVSVSFRGGAMSQLERVSINNVMGSGRISGITNLPSLKDLTAYTQQNEEWWDEVKAQLLQHPNRPSLFLGM